VQLYGSPFLWSSKAQSIQALSTAEAELNALVSAVHELNWIKLAVEGFGEKANAIIEKDNQSVIAIFSKPRNKRYQLCADYVKDRIEVGYVQTVEYKPTDEQPADCLTKVVNREAYKRIGLVEQSLILRGGMLNYWSNKSDHSAAASGCPSI